MIKRNYEETLNELLERMTIKEEFKQFENYANQIRKEDDFDDHDDDYYR